MRKGCVAAMLSIALGACAGRDPMPVATVQQQDAYADCAMIRAEIEANNTKAKELADEQGMKVAQNVAAGVVGLVIWPVWFAMDAKGAASKDAAALEARQKYLTEIAVDRCRPPPASARSLPRQPKAKPVVHAAAPIVAPAPAPEAEPAPAPYVSEPH